MLKKEGANITMIGKEDFILGALFQDISKDFTINLSRNLLSYHGGYSILNKKEEMRDQLQPTLDITAY